MKQLWTDIFFALFSPAFTLLKSYQSQLIWIHAMDTTKESILFKTKQFAFKAWQRY